VATRTRSHSNSLTSSLNGETLFSAARRADPSHAPLAERVRPRILADLVGQAHLFGGNKPLERAIEADRVPSMILWGPPGVGKTTLGKIIAERTKATFVMFSAVLGSLAELREIVAAAKERLDFRGEKTIVFVDEIHRFNKSQQDAFLPHVEAGTITLIGATTDNPSFAVNAALLSRAKVFRLEAIGEQDLVRVLERALADTTLGLGAKGIEVDPEALRMLARAARGDARRALGALEVATDFMQQSGENRLTAELVEAAQGHEPLLYDKSGEEHYNVVSAFIKSMRGSDPDAAIYWMMRMLEAGDDPLFVLRRMIIFASEDIGLADSRALMVVNAADEAFRRLGMPEGMYPLAHACCYLATAPKSNSVNMAWHRAKEMVAERGALPVPKKLRNAVTKLMKNEGYGASYKYAHDFEGGIVPGETYLPEEIIDSVFYEPTDRGEESRIKARLDLLKNKPKP